LVTQHDDVVIAQDALRVDGPGQHGDVPGREVAVQAGADDKRRAARTTSAADAAVTA
jgi:hypothetical protein